MEDQEFYARCARLLDTDYQFHAPPWFSTDVRHDGTTRNTYKTRWDGRDPGNGRFPGHGLIRSFGTTIQINLHTPHLSGLYGTREEAIAALVATLGVQETYSDEEVKAHVERAMAMNAAAQRTIRDAGIRADPRMVEARLHRATIVGFFQLYLSRQQTIATTMGIEVPPGGNDFERWRAFILVVRDQGRLDELAVLIKESA